MNSSALSSSPECDPSWPAWRAYLRSVAFLLPSVAAGSFAVLFLLPKVQMLWAQAGLHRADTAWLLHTATSLTNWGPRLLLGAGIFLVLLEFRWAAWPRYRRPVLTGVTLLFHTAVLVGLIAIAIAACLVAPLLAGAR